MQPGHIQSSTPSPNQYCTPGNLHQLPSAQALPLLSPPRSHTSSPALSIIEHNVCLNQKTTLRFLFRYPLGTTIEYPETSAEGSVGHLFEVSPDKWSNPRLSFAYSQGAPTGRMKSGHHTFCPLLVDDIGQEVPCREVHSTCMCRGVNKFDFFTTIF